MATSITTDATTTTLNNNGNAYLTVSASDVVSLTNPLPAASGGTGGTSGGGKVLQVVNVQTGAVATTTTAIPFDDTIPQNTEGGEFMTLAITPTSATSKLRIDVVGNGSCTDTSAHIAFPLFQDSTAGALAVAGLVPFANRAANISHTHYMTAGTTSETTFKVRGGASVGSTFTFNGTSSARKYGGVLASSITITEISA
tara:strand:+ start:480 stop:1076 length:597 start_codon:yes stop_codon:yes gene_type:complete